MLTNLKHRRSVKANNQPSFYIRRNLNYDIRLKTRKVGYVRTALVTNKQTRHIACYSVEKRLILANNDTFIMNIARIGANASIKAKRLKDVKWIDEINQNTLKDSQINGISYEDILIESYHAILNYSKYTFTPIVLIAMRGGNNLLNSVQRELAKNAALDGKTTSTADTDSTTTNESESDTTETSGNNSNRSERRKAQRSDSIPCQIETDIIKAEKLEYIFSRMTEEQVKLFKVWSESINRTKDSKTGKYHTERVKLSVIRNRMNYGNSISRMTISRRLKDTITTVRNLMKDYDSLSRNLLSFNDNTDSGDIIRISRKRTDKVVFNINGLNKVRTNAYQNVADHNSNYIVTVNPIEPNWNYDPDTKAVENERIRRAEYKNRLRHANADIRSLNDIRMKRIAHIMNMHNPLVK